MSPDEPVSIIMARSSIPQELWDRIRAITQMDEALLFPGDPNLRITIEAFDPEDGDSGRIA